MDSDNRPAIAKCSSVVGYVPAGVGGVQHT